MENAFQSGSDYRSFKDSASMELRHKSWNIFDSLCWNKQAVMSYKKKMMYSTVQAQFPCPNSKNYISATNQH